MVVFDLAGSVDAFMRAVSRIDGLEFLSEIEADEAEPDDEFYYESDGESSARRIPETLYMVMSNAQAVGELIRLFELWQADPTVKFEYGLGALKQVFSMLRAIRRWGPSDRIRDTGLLEAWEEDVQVAGAQGMARVEVELWFRDNDDRRMDVQADIEQVISSSGGRVIMSASIMSVDYHGILAEIPHSQVQAVLDHGPGAIELLTTETVMLVTPARPMMVPSLEVALDELDLSGLGVASSAKPRVALLDGLPMANHDSLVGRVIIDDPDGHAERYTSVQMQHGTAMASLICHGDLADPGPPLSTQLYARPIMEPHPHFSDREVVARDELLVDLVHRAFRRIFEGEGDSPPASASVRIVNLSLGDPVRVFARRMSPLAKLLDWLAHQYNLLILVSAGNHSRAVSVNTENFADSDALQRNVQVSLYEDARHRRLLAPAESINAVTVGALHADSAPDSATDTVVDAVKAGHPASYSAVGFGYRRSVKPEILLPGGRQLFQRPPSSDDKLVQLRQVPHTATGPGLVVAAPSSAGGSAGVAYIAGTSNATALASRTANHIFDVLVELAEGSDGSQFPDAQYYPVLAKALLIHAAGWNRLDRTLGSTLGLTGQHSRRALTQVLGYGRVDPERVANATRTRVALIGAGTISNKVQHRLQFPLPVALAATTDWRRLTITLAWLSPVNVRSRLHRRGRLKFEPPTTALAVSRTQVDHHAARRGTVQHEVLEGTAAIPFALGDALAIDVECRIEAGRGDDQIRYGIAASLEVADSVQADIHAQVREQLRVRLRPRIGPAT